MTRKTIVIRQREVTNHYALLNITKQILYWLLEKNNRQLEKKISVINLKINTTKVAFYFRPTLDEDQVQAF